MEEAFLHYIWKFQYFDKADLTTTEGASVSILRPGTQNSDKGADFQNSKVLIDNVEWNGCVEIHVNGKDWYQHQHDNDPGYNNVILHVVWDGQGKSTIRSDRSDVPVIELKDRVDAVVFEKYKKLTGSLDRIHCRPFLKGLDRLKVFEAFDKAIVVRLNRKAEEILIRLRKNNRDWEETCYQLLASNFGFKVNKEVFLSLAENLPFKVLQKHSDNLMQLEAMLFGVAGFLENDHGDEYYSVLKKEYHFLQRKYGLASFLTRHQWKFLRLRPANFPTIRIAQLAKLIHTQHRFFSTLIELVDPKKLVGSLKVEQSTYWIEHYDFGKKGARPLGVLGEDSISGILINTVAPLLAAYSVEKDDASYIEHALLILQNLKAEKNNIVNEWVNTGVKITSAFDSQACIELVTNFCTPRRCLSCSIGIDVIQRT